MKSEILHDEGIKTMPCYSEWDAYLGKGSKEYEDKKKELKTKLKAVKHIIDYYYGVERIYVPCAKYSGERTWQELAHREFSIDGDSLGEADEWQIIKKIAHHCSCDGINFTLLYDLVSLLNHRDPFEAGYVRVLLTCANEIRANKSSYESDLM